MLFGIRNRRNKLAPEPYSQVRILKSMPKHATNSENYTNLQNITKQLQKTTTTNYKKLQAHTSTSYPFPRCNPLGTKYCRAKWNLHALGSAETAKRPKDCRERGQLSFLCFLYCFAVACSLFCSLCCICCSLFVVCL